MSSSPQNLINKLSVSAWSMSDKFKSDFRFCSSLTRNLVLLSSQMTNQRRPNFQGYDEHVFDQNLFSSNYRKSQQKTFDQKKLLMKIWVFRQVCPAPGSSFVAIFSFLLFLQQVMAITSPTHSFPSEEKLIFNIFRNTRYLFTFGNSCNRFYDKYFSPRCFHWMLYFLYKTVCLKKGYSHIIYLFLWFQTFSESLFVSMNDRFTNILHTFLHTSWPRGWIYADIGLRYCWQAAVIHNMRFFTQDEKVLPWVFPDPCPHDEKHASPNQRELDEEWVKVGGRLCDNVPHQVDSTASEVVKFIRRCHLQLIIWQRSKKLDYRHERIPENPWQLVSRHPLPRRVVRNDVVETSPEKKGNLSRGKKQMVAPCARVDVLVARLGRVEGVVRIVHLRENIVEEKTFELKIL